MQCQDIIFTIILDDMTPEKYREIMDFIQKDVGSDVFTYTYDPESCPIEEVKDPLFMP